MKLASRIKDRMRLAYLLIAVSVLAIALSCVWEGPRTVYAHAVIICLDCIGII